MTEKEKKEITEKVGRKVRHEIYLMFLLSMVIDLMTYDVEREITKIDKTLCLKHESKQRMNIYLKKIKDCKDYFEAFISPTIIGSCSDEKFRDYENTRVMANEFARLIMMYYENCSKYENHIKVFEFLSQLTEGRGVFNDEDVNRFNLGT